MNSLINLTARQIVDGLKSGDYAPEELLDALEQRMGEVEPRINAICVNLMDRARDRLKGLDAPARESLRATGLAGLPLLMKELNDIEGVVTCMGSTVLKDAVAERSDLTVQTLERNGAVIYGKSNVPEFAGANTYNDVYGITRNPWDLRLSVAGSSGGSAAALASGAAWLASGNDLGGSLRTPASFCSVVSLRPSPGRVARGPGKLPFDTLWVEGPMARNVGDVGLMFDAQIGYDPRDPISLPSEGVSYRATAERPLRPEQFAFSPDLGVCAVAREVRDICRTAADKAASDGVTMSEAPPPLAGVYEVFHTLRAHLIAGLYETLIREHRDEIKPDIVWNVEKGAAQAVSEVSAAERERAALIAGFDGFLEREKFLLTPAAQVLPFPVEQKFPTEIDGKPLETYVDWITITFALSTVAVPVAVVPCGYSKSGLPVAMQIVAPRRREHDLLSVAAYFEQLWGCAPNVPLDPKETASPPASNG